MAGRRKAGKNGQGARNHIRALLRAIGVHSRLEAVLTGLRSGVLDHELTQAGHEEPAEAADE